MTTHTTPATAPVPAPVLSTADPRPTDADHTAPRWPAWARVVGAVVVFIVSLLLVGLLAPLVALVLPDGLISLVVQRIVEQVLVALVAVAMLTCYVRRVERRRLAFTGMRFTRWSLPLMVVGVLASAAALAVAAGPAAAFGTLRHGEGLGGGPGVPAVLLVVLAFSQGLLLQALPEELIFRGYVVRTLASRPWVAVVTSVLVFTALHIVSSGGQNGLAERLLYLAVPCGFATSAVGLALLTRSLWPAVGVHAGFHWASMAAVSMGLGDGPALWAALGLVHLLIGVVALTLWQLRSGRVEYVR